jgi:predicted transcriptional regulator YdeE
MEKYSHGAFQITGYKISTTKKDNQEARDIGEAWAKFISEKIGDTILHKVYNTIHVVYFNYTNKDVLLERGYDMLIGFITEDGGRQENKNLNTITIPAQDYEYVKVIGEMPESLVLEWQKVNAMTKEECNRAYGYDMDMYSDDMKSVTLTVSVNK